MVLNVELDAKIINFGHFLLQIYLHLKETTFIK